MARNSASAVARCAALTLLAATATVMPRPIAAGVFGMARTTLPPQTASSEAMVVPAMIETTSVDGPVNGLNVGAGLAERLRLHRNHQRIDLAGILRCRIKPDSLRRQRADLGREMRLDHHDAPGIEAAGQPSRQHRAAHLAGAGEAMVPWRF